MSMFVVHRSLIDSLEMLSLPVILANVFSSSIEQLKKFATRFDDFFMFNLALSSGSCVAIPTGHLPELQILYC
jgi:hypothetical protein